MALGSNWAIGSTRTRLAGGDESLLTRRPKVRIQRVGAARNEADWRVRVALASGSLPVLFERRARWRVMNRQSSTGSGYGPGADVPGWSGITRYDQVESSVRVLDGLAPLLILVVVGSIAACWRYAQRGLYRANISEYAP